MSFEISGNFNGIFYGKNVDFTGAFPPTETMVADGVLLIGDSVSPNIKVGNIISSSLDVTYVTPNIVVETKGGGQPIEQITVDNSSLPGVNPVVPSSTGNLTITGGQVANSSLANVIQTDSLALHSFSVVIQRSAASLAADLTQNGVSHFNSAQFSVDTDGFVSIIGGGFKWNDISGAFSPLKENGYFITGTATGTLPASPSQGDTIKFIVDHASQVLTIQATGTQVIRLGSSVTSAAGSAVSTARGDEITLVYRSTGTLWVADSSIGNWTLSA